MNQLAYYVLSAFAVLITLTVHEYFHGYFAYKLGDPTARNCGRLTLNPIKHIDPIGALCMVFFHIGWAKPVPVNSRYLKKPRRDLALISLAGPLSNLVMAFISALVVLILNAVFSSISFGSEFLLSAAKNTVTFFLIFHTVNIGIAIFNLIPIPPLDGSKILGVILPPKMFFSYMRHERTLYYVLLGWLLLGNIASDFLLSIPAIYSSPVLSVIATLISLSNILGYAIGAISDLMMNFWQLIPFL